MGCCRSSSLRGAVPIAGARPCFPRLQFRFPGSTACRLRCCARLPDDLIYFCCGLSQATLCEMNPSQPEPTEGCWGSCCRAWGYEGGFLRAVGSRWCCPRPHLPGLRAGRGTAAVRAGWHPAAQDGTGTVRCLLWLLHQETELIPLEFFSPSLSKQHLAGVGCASSTTASLRCCLCFPLAFLLPDSGSLSINLKIATLFALDIINLVCVRSSPLL